MKTIITIIGHYHIGGDMDAALGGGQLTKTRNIYNQLVKEFGEKNILLVDTYGWKKKGLKLLVQIINSIKKSQYVIIMPNKNGIRIILPIVTLLKNRYNYKIIYPVVGGWLKDFVDNNRKIKSYFSKIDFILPETDKLACEIKTFFNNDIDVMPVFSNRQRVQSIKDSLYWNEPYVFATFSRVTPEKGIDDAIKAVRAINSKFNRIICRLEICGPIDERYQKHYEDAFKRSEGMAVYRGVLPDKDLIEILSNYYMLLFPTYYPGEGFPATICESYLAGLPIIASNWRFNSDLIDENATGLLFNTRDIDMFQEKIEYAINNPQIVYKMRENCLRKSMQYDPNIASRKIIDWIYDDCHNR